MASLGRVLADLLAQSGTLLGTRLELLGLEALDARARLLRQGALLLAGVALLLLAVLVGTLTLALWFWPTEYRYLALGLLTLLYALLGLACLICLWRGLHREPPLFAVTAQVLREDAMALRRGPTADVPVARAHDIATDPEHPEAL